DPRGLDPAPGAVGFLALDDPALGVVKGKAPEERERPALVGPQDAVEAEKSAGPRRGGRGRLEATGAQFVDGEGERPGRPVRGHHGEGDDGAAGPAGEVVDI